MVDHYLVFIRDRITEKRFLFLGIFDTLEDAIEKSSNWKDAGDIEIVPCNYSKSKYRTDNKN